MILHFHRLIPFPSQSAYLLGLEDAMTTIPLDHEGRIGRLEGALEQMNERIGNIEKILQRLQWGGIGAVLVLILKDLILN